MARVLVPSGVMPWSLALPSKRGFLPASSVLALGLVLPSMNAVVLLASPLLLVLPSKKGPRPSASVLALALALTSMKGSRPNVSILPLAFPSAHAVVPLPLVLPSRKSLPDSSVLALSFPSKKGLRLTALAIVPSGRRPPTCPALALSFALSFLRFLVLTSRKDVCLVALAPARPRRPGRGVQPVSPDSLERFVHALRPVFHLKEGPGPPVLAFPLRRVVPVLPPIPTRASGQFFEVCAPTPDERPAALALFFLRPLVFTSRKGVGLVVLALVPSRASGQIVLPLPDLFHRPSLPAPAFTR